MIEVLKCYDGFKDVNVFVDVGGYQGVIVVVIVVVYFYICGINFDLFYVIVEVFEFFGICFL